MKEQLILLLTKLVNMPGSKMLVWVQELRCVLILNGYVSYPRRRMFWEISSNSHHCLVANAIRRD